MFKSKPILGFFLKFAVFHRVLMGLWSAFYRRYRAFFEARPILGFFLKFAVLYGLLMGLWSVVYPQYRAFFKAGGEFVFRVLWTKDVVRLEALPEPEPLSGNETKVFVEQKGSPSWKSMPICIRDIGYLSTAVLVALVLATPIRWSRRVKALLLGLLILHGIIVVRLGILVATLSSLNTPDPWLAHKTFWTKALDAAIVRLSLGQPLGYIVAVVTWILVSLRREDLKILLSESGDSSSRPRGG